jgi:hypothetical protein
VRVVLVELAVVVEQRAIILYLVAQLHLVVEVEVLQALMQA